jgi:hypothetical protein
MREAMAADAARKGPAGALARAILSLLELILALLAELRAGTLAAQVSSRATAAAAATREASATCAASAEAAAACRPAAAALWPARADRAGDREARLPLAAPSADRFEDTRAGRISSADHSPRPSPGSQEANPIEVTKLSLVAYGNLVHPECDAPSLCIGPPNKIGDGPAGPGSVSGAAAEKAGLRRRGLVGPFCYVIETKTHRYRLSGHLTLPQHGLDRGRD